MTTPKSITEKGVHSLSALGRITDKITEYETLQRSWVTECRNDGCSWRMIGVALGVTAQAAYSKHSGHQRDSEVQGSLLDIEAYDVLEREGSAAPAAE